LRKHAGEFEQLKATVVLVYPGEAKGLKKRAEEFLKDSPLPKPFLFVIDPDYAFTTKYGLRWDAKAETAYPATFVLDKDRVVRFQKVSKSHGDRSKAEDVLTAIKGLKTADSAKGRDIPQDRGSAPQLSR
jgi:peroxiredoxin